MKVFFDNCTSPILASVLDGYLRHRKQGAVHISELPCGRHAPDVAWIAYLAGTKDDWLVVTGDLRIQRNPPERRAYRQANLKGLVLARAFQDFPVHRQAAFILWRWTDIADIVRLTAPPFLFELPANRTSRIRALPL